MKYRKFQRNFKETFFFFSLAQVVDLFQSFGRVHFRRMHSEFNCFCALPGNPPFGRVPFQNLKQVTKNWQRTKANDRILNFVGNLESETAVLYS